MQQQPDMQNAPYTEVQVAYALPEDAMSMETIAQVAAPLAPAATVEEPGFDAVLASPQTWVALAFVLLFVFFGKKLFGALFRALDYRSGRIKNELEEAERLRTEAEAVLASYREKHRACLKEAEGILAKAREDADRLVKEAQAELKIMLEARRRMAEEKILQAEKQAVDEVRDHVVDITISAAKTLIMENIAQTSGDELIRRAIADIERKVH